VKKLYPAERNLFGKARRFVHAVDQVDLDICSGQMFGLVGESGCGKSTLGYLILGLEPATGGSIRFEGEELSSIALRQKMQIVFQNPTGALSPRKSVEFLMAEPMMVNGLCQNRKESRPAVVEMLAKVKLGTEVLHRFPHQLSGGQQQRVCIARALSVHPCFIVLDEPTSSLDVSVQAKVLNLLAELKGRESLTYLLITHDISIVEYLCDDVAVMYLGEIVEINKASSLRTGARHPYTKLLMWSAFDEGVGKAESLGEPPSAVDLPSGCRFKNRCSFSLPLCHEQHPELKSVGDGGMCRCHRVAGEAG
jgi:oligopeptide/dipeptide ABC transporter ATP-binding protein